MGFVLQTGSLLLIAAAWLFITVVSVTVPFTLNDDSSTERQMPVG